MNPLTPAANPEGAEGERRRYLWFDTTNRMRAVAAQRRAPLIGALELTARCNLSCQMCFVRREGTDPAVVQGELDAAAWRAVARQAIEEGTLFLLLTGGEPLLRPDFWEIYDPLSEMGFFLTLFTNATLVGDREAALFKKRPPSKAVVTLYGASPETYGRVCGDPAAFARAVAGVRRLVAAGVKTELRATISRDNIGDREALKDLANELVGVRSIETSLLLTPAVRGGCARPLERRLTPDEVVDLGGKDTDCPTIRTGEDEDGVTVTPVSGAIPRESLDTPGRYESLPPMFCAGGRCSFWIAWDGRMLPCALMDHPFTRPVQDGFAKAWKGLTEETERIPGASECGTCSHRPYCAVCPGRLQAETGSFTTVAPYLCGVAQRVHASVDGSRG
jgi:radical SAM protein with 4Fe4S-binding SPASM domain